MASEVRSDGKSWVRPPLLLIVLVVACLCIDASAAALDDGPWLGPSRSTFAWLVFVAVPLGFVHARVPNGYLSLGGIATTAAALTVNPKASLLVSLVPSLLSNIVISRASVVTRLCLVLGATGWTVAPSWVALTLRHLGEPEPAVEAIALMVYTATNWLVAASVGAAVLQVNPLTVLRDNLNRHWVAAFMYICLSAALIHNLLDGTIRGYVLGILAVVLSLALADAVAGRELNRALLSQLTDVERHLGYSRIVEGTIHNVRNFLSAAIANLEEARDAHTEQQRRRRLETSLVALQDASQGLVVLSSGSSPHVRWSNSPINLADLAQNVAALLRDRAASRRISLEVQRSADPAVYCDPSLIREVIANLTLNAIEAAPTGGRVAIQVGWRLQDAYLSVSDNGQGVSDIHRDRLFEPHFTTKPDGSGIGLFISYGIVREHRGALLYEGGSDGAVFTVLLKRDGRAG